MGGSDILAAEFWDAFGSIQDNPLVAPDAVSVSPQEYETAKADLLAGAVVGNFDAFRAAYACVVNSARALDGDFVLHLLTVLHGTYAARDVIISMEFLARRAEPAKLCNIGPLWMTACRDEFTELSLLVRVPHLCWTRLCEILCAHATMRFSGVVSTSEYLTRARLIAGIVPQMHTVVDGAVAVLSRLASFVARDRSKEDKRRFVGDPRPAPYNWAAMSRAAMKAPRVAKPAARKRNYSKSKSPMTVSDQ